jgi:thymidylate synthase (FAD)
MNTIKCLDHGFVTLLNTASAVPRNIVEDNLNGVSYTQFSARDIDPSIAARISFNNLDEVRIFEQDIKLLEYLMVNYHNTPLEMTELWFHMKMPIFVARQAVRHRTSRIFEGITEYDDPTINEVSGRYVQLPAQWYIPEVVGGKSTTGAKQGQEDNLKLNFQDMFKQDLEALCAESYAKYLYYLEGRVAPEHARMFLHVNHYTHWIWKQDLHNVLGFLKLRLHEHAQIEARVYAQAILKLLIQQLPATMELFDKYRK